MITRPTSFHPVVRARQGRAVTAAGLGVAVLAAATGVQADATVRSSTGINPTRDIGTVIEVQTTPGTDAERVHLQLLGANHRWLRNGDGLWSAAYRRPVRRVVLKTQQAGVQTARYPGGTVATLFDWKEAIGPQRRRGCQFEGRYNHGNFMPARRATAFGPDEYMQFVEASDTAPLLMETVVNQTPGDAADWVEYMNHPLRQGNPNRGVNYAKLRAANGHPRPYDVKRWEVGNEPYVAPARYALSSDPATALRQYTDGGKRKIVREYLGKGCRHPVGGVRANGERNQEFRTLYRPVSRPSFQLSVDGNRWRLVKNFRRSGARDRVYTLAAGAGIVTFGNGRHGKIPRKTQRVPVTYVNHFDGYFAFARAMRSVDPTIDVCASWGQEEFVRVASPRRVDCLTAHSITNFPRTGEQVWGSKLEGHDRLMRALDTRKDHLKGLQRALKRQYPGRTPPLALSEITAIHGDRAGWPYWRATIGNAVYMATMLSFSMNEGVVWATGGDLLGVGEGSIIGAPQSYTLSAEAEVRKTLLPMLDAGGRTLPANIENNPLSRVLYDDERIKYNGLQVSATEDPRGGVWLLVINKLADTTIKAKIRLTGYGARPGADVFQTAAKGFGHWNRDGEEPRVEHLGPFEDDDIEVTTGVRGNSSASITVAANSVTVYHFRPQR